MTIRVRVAPSPTGDPHVGTAYMALFNKAFARKSGGTFILRIEDTDRERSTAESEAMIFSSLRWLGFDWDEGPDIGGPFGPYRQSERSDLYKRHADILVEKGAAYRCFCTAERLDAMRQAQKAAKETSRYDRFCRNLDPAEAKRRADHGEKHVIRLAVPTSGETGFKDQLRGQIAFQNDVIDDQILLKGDGFPTYHLANVVDDHEMHITHVIRAEEWINSTPKHILLYEAFGWIPPEFTHMPLLRNPDGSKISKRKNPTSIEWYRQSGYLPEALLNFLALCGYSMPDNREIFSFNDMVQEFDWNRVNTSGPVFNLEKCTWLNGEYIRALSPEDLAKRLLDLGVVPSGSPPDMLPRIIPLIQPRIKTLVEFNEVADFFYANEIKHTLEVLVPKKKEPGETRDLLKQSRDLLASASAWTTPALEESMRSFCETCGWKTKDLFMALRVAVTGKTASPPLFESMEVLGREKTLARLDAAVQVLG